MAHQIWELAVTHQWLPSIPFAHTDFSLCEELHLLARNQYPQLSRIALLLWSIWKSRNALVFNNESTSPMGTLLRAKRSWADWMIRKSSSASTSSTSFSSPP